MKTTIDAAGRVVIPKPIPEKARLSAGDTLDMSFRDGRIEIKLAPIEVRLVRRGRLTVAEPLEPLAQVTLDDLNREIDAVRSDRGRL